MKSLSALRRGGVSVVRRSARLLLLAALAVVAAAPLSTADELPLHTAYVSAFYMDKHEVNV